MAVHTWIHKQEVRKSLFWPNWNVTEYPRWAWTGCKEEEKCWWSADPIKGTLWLDFRLFQFTKSARQTINVRTANVKTSLTPIKFHQGHSKCMLMLAWDQTSPIKDDLKWGSWWGGVAEAAKVWLVWQGSRVNSPHKGIIFWNPTYWRLKSNIEQHYGGAALLFLWEGFESSRRGLPGQIHVVQFVNMSEESNNLPLPVITVGEIVSKSWCGHVCCVLIGFVRIF